MRKKSDAIWLCTIYDPRLQFFMLRVYPHTHLFQCCRNTMLVAHPLFAYENKPKGNIGCLHTCSEDIIMGLKECGNFVG